MGTAYDRQVCVNEHCSVRKVQLLFRGSINIRGGCSGSELVRRKQLCKPTVLSTKQNNRKDSHRSGSGYRDSSMVAKSSLVSKTTGTFNCSSLEIRKQPRDVSEICRYSRATEELKVDDLRLENIWKGRLRLDGWPEPAVEAVVFNWAPSTLETYSRHVCSFVDFTLKRGVDPGQCPTNVVASYFVEVASRSNRPKSLLDSNSAALACYYDGINERSPIDVDVRKLITGLVKTGMTEPMKCSNVMSTQPFMDLFMSWPENGALSMEFHHLKTNTLLALCAMLRPSDIAPRSVSIKKNGMRNIQFTADRVVFKSDGSMRMFLFGIKNDYSREGFEVPVVPASVHKLCPVETMQDWLKRTESINPSSTRPVFFPLNCPFDVLSASSVSSILSKSIKLAGLSGKGYTPKLFRPMGATVAIQSKMDPDMVRKIGHWKDRQCFEDHYVHSVPHKNMSNVVLNIV